jgi:NitT/TauT family transport system substrate-binding protein
MLPLRRKASSPSREYRLVALRSLAGFVALAIAAFTSASAIAEPIKIALLKQGGSGPLFIAEEKGYFAAEGVPAELVYFADGQAVAVAVVSGDIDFGVVGISGGFYSLAGQGALRIIAGAYREAPGFPLFAIIASNRAYAAGLKSYKDLPGHSAAVTAIGSAGHYTLALIAEKFGFDLKSLRILPTQSTSNSNSAVAGGQVDAGMQLASSAVTMLQNGSVQLLGWAGDDVPWQTAVAFTATKTANDRRDTVERFLRAYRNGARTYHDAFIGPDEKRADGPSAQEIMAIIAKYNGLSTEQVGQAIAYVDPEARLDVKDVRHQIAWFKSQGMVKGEIDSDAIIDQRYVIPLPAH